MPLGGWWGDVLFCVKEDATAALGVGAGDGGELEHTVWIREREVSRWRGMAQECSTLLCFIYISDTLLHRGSRIRGEKEEMDK